MQRETPAAPAVRDTLERLLSSRTFGRSERARKLLRYLVEREQAGQADLLKGFSIAVDVFGKDSDFDSSTDSLVRVQAGRLRDLLKQYFKTEGATEDIRIDIPRGSYVPSYAFASAHASSGKTIAETGAIRLPADTAREPAVRIGKARQRHDFVLGHLKLIWAALALVIFILGAQLMLNVREASNTPLLVAGNETDRLATNAVTALSANDQLPRVYVVSRSDDAPVTLFEGALRNALSRFDTVDLMARDADHSTTGEDRTLQFRFEIATGPSSGSVLMELQHLATAKVLFSRVFLPDDLRPESIDDEIAEMVTASIPVAGTIYSFIEQNSLQTGLVACLLLNDDYYLDQSRTGHEVAYRCFETLVRQGSKSPLALAELASLQFEAANLAYDYPPASVSAEALDNAHRALVMGANSAYAHRAYGYMQSRMGNKSEAVRWLNKAYELNPYDLTMAAAYGYGLVMASEYDQAVPILARAVEVASVHPSWWDYGLFLGAFMTNDMALANKAAVRFATVKRSHYLAARLIVAQWEKDEPLADSLRRDIRNDYKKFAANPRAVFSKRLYPDDMVDRLSSALQAAGLGNPS
ncbi:hypothetical protein ABFT80_16290 [Mesorhizobium sp. SB112]|uniref:tetratricopeptide repeat protein n=1 Tax=Mesorhizobium sp. SB112 TaxID=3151853 RepID=UPI003262FB15